MQIARNRRSGSDGERPDFDADIAADRSLEDELLAAISFFEKTTGINSPRGWDEVGQVIVPTPELNKDFERWRVWYVEHQQSLYLDAATGELRLRSNQGR